MFHRIGQFSARFRYPIIVFWVLAAVLITLLAPNLSDLGIADQSSYLPRDEPSVVADQIMAEYFPGQVSSSRAVLVIKSEEGSLLEGPGQAYLAELAAYLQSDQAPASIDDVLSPTDPNLASQLIAADGRVAMFAVGLHGAVEDKATIDALETMQARLDSAPAGLAGYVTGSVAIMNNYKSGVLESAERTTIITIALVIIILLVIYRSPVAPIIPLATIGIAFLVSRGLIALLAGLGLTVSSITEVVLVVLLFGAGTDYCLFLVSRFGEVLGEGLPGPVGAQRVVARVGETISSSAGTVIVGMVALSFTDMKLFASTGPSLALGVFITLLAGLTLAPALMAVLGKRVFWPKGSRQPSGSGLWAKIADMITARPWVPVLVVLALLVPLAIYGQGMQRNFDLLADLPDSMPSKAGFQVLSEAFGAGAMQPLDVVLTGIPDAHSPEGMAHVDALTRELQAVPGVADVRSLAWPAGKAQPEMRDALRVESQLALVATAIDNLRPQLTDPAALLASTDLAQGAAGLDALQGYLDELAAAFPDIAGNANHRVALESLAGLKQGLEDGQQQLLVSNQLTLAAGMAGAALEAPAGSQADSVQALGEAATQFDALRSYVVGLGQAHPPIAGMEGYDQTLAALDALDTTLAGVEESLLVSRQLDLVVDGLGQVAAPLQDPAVLAKLAESPEQMAALALLHTYLDELGQAQPALAAQPEFQSAVAHLTAAQAAADEAMQARLVGPQLTLIAGRMDETAKALAENPLALLPKAGEPSAADQMSVLVVYLQELGETYPSLATTADYQTALTTADQMSTQLATFDLAKLNEQIAQAGQSLATLSAAFSGLSAVAAQTLSEDATFVPKDLSAGALSLAPDLSPILDEVAAAGDDLAAVAAVARRDMPAATFIPSQALTGAGTQGAALPFTNPLPAVTAGVQDLVQGMEQLAASVAAGLPAATYIPPQELMAGQADALTGPLLADLDRFQGALTGLAGDLQGQGDHFFVPTTLAGSMGQASLLGSGTGQSVDWAAGIDQLLDTYSTADGSAARLQVILDSDPFGPQALNTVAQLRDKVQAASTGYVSGSTATNLDLQQVMERDMTKVMILVLAGISVVLAFLLRSLVAPIYMLLTILLSYGATLGITRLIFDRGLTWFVPFLIFVLLVAIGMDYNIFIMGRVKEEVANGDVRSGVKRAVQHTGGIIASAGVIMAATFAAMMSSSLQGLVQLALAIAVGVLLDAFVVVILVSAIAVLFGRWNWWPGRGPGH